LHPDLETGDCTQQRRDGRNQRSDYLAKDGQAFDLMAARCAVQAPLAEVLAVVAQQLIPILTDTPTRTPNHLLRGKNRMGRAPHPDRPVQRELVQAHLLHGSRREAVGKAGVVNDPPTTHVDPVMRIVTAACDDLGTELRLLILE
jgi:hypothetical protein